MQAAQMQQQMQAMVQGMWLQAVSQQQAGASPKAAMPAGPVPAQAGGKEYQGILKSLSSRNGYGFIDCAEIKSQYGRDVYVSADLLPEGAKETGARLKFTVGQNSKGHPQARTCS